MEAWELADVLATVAASGRPYHEAVRSHDLSVGVYVLAAGGVDHQSPHTEDEVYYVVSGRGTLSVGDEERPVTAGSIVFVAADVPHRFHDITEELVVLVAFGPAEYTHRVDHDRGHPHGAVGD
ncbi:MAG TPA: cupin domain-containing protein [Candidatus Acidoferrales bacterium]|jgi:mannose-6-phosphate isomerase-like protein (cupin superfamily)|nr:cupin domain-containing protein [Candidatus Acidoferrales bacterium]